MSYTFIYKSDQSFQYNKNNPSIGQNCQSARVRQNCKEIFELMAILNSTSIHCHHNNKQ